MARIEKFIIGTGKYDQDKLTHDLLTKLTNDHVGKENAIRHKDVCRYYFSPFPIYLENQFIISEVLQKCRRILEKSGWILEGKGKSGWFLARTEEEAFDHFKNATKRVVTLHGRVKEKANILTGNRYKLPANNPLIQAIHGMTPAMKRLNKAYEKTQINAPEEESD